MLNCVVANHAVRNCAFINIQDWLQLPDRSALFHLNEFSQLFSAYNLKLADAVNMWHKGLKLVIYIIFETIIKAPIFIVNDSFITHYLNSYIVEKYIIK